MFEDFFKEFNTEIGKEIIERPQTELSADEAWDTGEPQKFWKNNVDKDSLWKN